MHDFEPVKVDGGTTNSERTLYQSSAPVSTWLPFSSGTIYDFPHEFGRVPTSVQTYLSFDEHPLDGVAEDADHPDHVSEGAGNQTVIERWDDEIVRVRNDTCANFYLRVVIRYEDEISAAGGAGGSSP